MRTRLRAAIGSLLFFVLAPGTIAGWIPYLFTRWRLEPPFFGITAGRIFGALLIAAGIAALVHSFTRFAFEGRGTPAPLAPTEILVVSGLYRHVRNPMYVAVVSIILGEALLLGSDTLLWYGAAVWLAFHLFVLAYEEPTLSRRYGAQYITYRAHVPRWLPRVKPY